MEPIKIHMRSTPDWFTPYNVNLRINGKYNVHVWFPLYMWMFVSQILFFHRKKKDGYNTIGGKIWR